MPAMSRIAEAARLKEMEAKAEPGPYRLEGSDILVGDRSWIGPAVAGDEDYQILVDMRNAALWLLDVAGQFQAGDATRIEEILEHFTLYGDPIGGVYESFLHRMLAAAQIMEAEP